MKHIYLDKIKSLESPPKKINIFSEKEIKMIKELYDILPEITFNKKQNIRKNLIQEKQTLVEKLFFVEKKNSLLTDSVDLDYLETMYRKKFFVGKASEKVYITE